MKEVDVRTDIVIRRPRDVVASYAADPDRAPEWYVNIESAEWRTPGPLRVGSRIAFKAKFLGRRLAYEYEVVEYVPGEKLTMRTSDGPFPMETTYEWRGVGADATRMTLRNRGRPLRFSKLLSPLLVPAMRRANRKDLETLKRMLENN